MMCSFDLSKDPGVWNGKRLDSIVLDDIHTSFYFDFYK